LIDADGISSAFSRCTLSIYLADHLNACPEPIKCPGGPIVSPIHPCGCPDCSKPHPNDPNFAHGYCYVPPASTTDTTSDTTAASSSNTTNSTSSTYLSSSNTSNSTNNNSTSGTSQNSSPQTAQRIFNPLYLIMAAAGAAVGLAGAVLLPKMVRTNENVTQYRRVRSASYLAISSSHSSPVPSIPFFSLPAARVLSYLTATPTKPACSTACPTDWQSLVLDSAEQLLSGATTTKKATKSDETGAVDPWPATTCRAVCVDALRPWRRAILTTCRLPITDKTKWNRPCSSIFQPMAAECRLAWWPIQSRLKWKARIGRRVTPIMLACKMSETARQLDRDRVS
jgi:hypothetical protein